jgi:hypothetical protein
MEYGTWNMEHGTWNMDMEYGVWNMEHKMYMYRVIAGDRNCEIETAGFLRRK